MLTYVPKLAFRFMVLWLELILGGTDIKIKHQPIRDKNLKGWWLISNLMVGKLKSSQYLY